MSVSLNVSQMLYMSTMYHEHCVTKYTSKNQIQWLHKSEL